MSLALPFSLPFYTGIPATFAVCCLLSALIGLEYLVAVLQSGGWGKPRRSCTCGLCQHTTRGCNGRKERSGEHVSGAAGIWLWGNVKHMLACWLTGLREKRRTHLHGPCRA